MGINSGCCLKVNSAASNLNDLYNKMSKTVEAKIEKTEQAEGSGSMYESVDLIRQNYNKYSK